jgi:hypothetical protein
VIWRIWACKFGEEKLQPKLLTKTAKLFPLIDHQVQILIEIILQGPKSGGFT